MIWYVKSIDPDNKDPHVELAASYKVSVRLVEIEVYDMIYLPCDRYEDPMRFNTSAWPIQKLEMEISRKVVPRPC